MKYEILKIEFDLMLPNKFKTQLITPDQIINGEREPSIESILREGWEPFHYEKTISRIEWIFKRPIKNGSIRDTLVAVRTLIMVAARAKQPINSEELINLLGSIIEDL